MPGVTSIFSKDFLINHFVMTGEIWEFGGKRGRGGMYCDFIFYFHFFKYMSVISYTDVCFIIVAAEDIFLNLLL